MLYCLQASALPLSIIIVGIGGADFEGLWAVFSDVLTVCFMSIVFASLNLIVALCVFLT